jgi:RNA polymerase sigma-70 factor (ECF subfamily)
LASERELWSKISNGNPEAFDAFYLECAPRLLGFLRHLLAEPQAAEDVMQNAFTEIWRRPGGFDPERGSLRAYLFGVARKQAMEWRRRHRSAEELADIASPAQVETSSVVADAFNRLTPEQRTLLWLREVEGQSYAELAAILDIPVGTVRSRLFAAREALRTIWTEAPSMKGDRP